MGNFLYYLLISYFLIGGILFYYINRKKSKSQKRKSLQKYISYFIILNIYFFSISINSVYFHYFSILIIFISILEIIRLVIKKKKYAKGIAIIFVFSYLAYLFFKFSQLNQNILFYVVLIVTIFDAFSQMMGQIFGKQKLLPRVSPQKTVEGLVGGFVFAVLSSILTHKLFEQNIIQSIFWALGISIFSFCGDFAASYIKRMFYIKDFGTLIPGHGGFLDRFDSLISSGALTYIVLYLY